MAQRISDETRARIAQAWPDVCAALADGELVSKVLEAHAITQTQKRVYLAETPGARREWDDAREASADAYMDRALEEAMANYSKEEAGHARTRIDTLKWAARIRNPRLYGDKAQLDVNVRTVDLTRIISEAQARLEASRIVGRVIEHEGARRLEIGQGGGTAHGVQEIGAEP